MLPSLSVQSCCGITLWEWPSITASKPEVFAMTSVDIHGEQEGSMPRVREPDDVIRTGGLGFVDALLHRRIQRLPIATAQKS